MAQNSVSKLLALCKVDDLTKQRSMKDMGVEDRSWCETQIREFSRLAEKYTGREFMFMERTRDFTVSAYQSMIRVKAFGHPDSAIGDLWQSLSGVYDSTTRLADSDYVFDWEENGIITKRFGNFLAGVHSVRVKWTGGVAADTDQVPEDLRGVAITQVTAWYQRRDSLNIASQSIGGETITRFSEMDLLPLTKRVLDDYKVVSL